MTAARTFNGPEIEEMDRELTRVIEDFDRAVNVEALHRIRETSKRTEEADKRTKEAGKYLLSQSGDSSFSMGSCRARASA